MLLCLYQSKGGFSFYFYGHAHTFDCCLVTTGTALIAAERSQISPHVIRTKKLKMSQSPYINTEICTMYFETFSSCMDHCVNSVTINFTLNLTPGVFIDRIYRINHTETWNFNSSTLVTCASHKITAKCGIQCPKTLLWTEKQLHVIHFFAATRKCLRPAANPRILCAKHI